MKTLHFMFEALIIKILTCFTLLELIFKESVNMLSTGNYPSF